MDSSLNIANAAGDLWPKSIVRVSVDVKLLMKGIKSSGNLAKLALTGFFIGVGQGYTSKVRDKELDQISRVIRYQSWEILAELI